MFSELICNDGPSVLQDIFADPNGFDFVLKEIDIKEEGWTNRIMDKFETKKALESLVSRCVIECKRVFLTCFQG